MAQKLSEDILQKLLFTYGDGVSAEHTSNSTSYALIFKTADDKIKIENCILCEYVALWKAMNDY